MFVGVRGGSGRVGPRSGVVGTATDEGSFLHHVSTGTVQGAVLYIPHPYTRNHGGGRRALISYNDDGAKPEPSALAKATFVSDADTMHPSRLQDIIPTIERILYELPSIFS